MKELLIYALSLFAAMLLVFIDMATFGLFSLPGMLMAKALWGNQVSSASSEILLGPAIIINSILYSIIIFLIVMVRRENRVD